MSHRSAILLCMLAACWFAACADADDSTVVPCESYRATSEPSCRASGDCGDGTYCAPPGTSPCGGYCPMDMPPNDQCAVDADCGDGKVCFSAPWGCGCPYSERRCAADCRVDTAVCDETKKCGADGLCEPRTCAGDGYDCPSNLRCGGEGAADEHGCVRLPCGRDDDCDCGACLDVGQGGRCYDGLGICLGPSA